MVDPIGDAERGRGEESCGEESCGEEFWRFSLDLYGRPGAPERCLRMQDAHGCDVNMVLFAIWAGLRRGTLTAEAARAAAHLSEEWARRAVRPLRAIRRDLKAGVAGFDAEPFRSKVKALELAAEELQQRALAGRVETAGPAGVAAAERNLMLYLEAAKLDAAAALPDGRALIAEAAGE